MKIFHKTSSRKEISCLLVMLCCAVGTAMARTIPYAQTNIVVDGPFNGANCVAAGDLDGDGDMDLVGMANTDDDITWFENLDGAGTQFATNVINGNYNGAFWVEVVDLDQDGDLDLVGTASAADDVTWWENINGDASSWTERTIDSFFDGAKVLRVGDLDLDGDPDVLVAGSVADEVHWWENTDGTAMSWSEHAVDTNLNGANSVCIGDVDGDGQPDIAAAGDDAGTIAWYRNTGDPDAWTLQVVTTNFLEPHAACIVDMNRDGAADILAASAGQNRVMWFENTAGDGSVWVERPVDISLGNAIYVTAADLDQDGDLDLTAVGQQADDLVWYENTAGATNWFTHLVNGSLNGAISVVPADIDSDGDLDLATAAFIDDSIHWYRNEQVHRSAFFRARQLIETSFYNAVTIESGDMNNDGWPDLVALSRGGPLSVCLNPGSSGSWAVVQIDNTQFNRRDLAVDDFDNDGDLDLFTAGEFTGPVTFFENSGAGTSYVKTTVSLGGSIFGAIAKDLDQDGRTDLVLANPGSNAVQWIANTATGFALRVAQSGISNPKGIDIDDLDRDGDPDIAYIWPGVALGWLQNDGGASSWSMHAVDIAAPDVQNIASSDLSGDGFPDLLVSASNGTAISWYENPYPGTNWTLHTVPPSVPGPVFEVAADLDYDRIPEILSVSAGNDALGLLENAYGPGSNWVYTLLDAGLEGLSGLSVEDYDRDGLPDIAAVETNGHISMYWNVGGAVLLTSTGTVESYLQQFSRTGILEITAGHAGRPGDADVQISSLHFMMEEAPGFPLQPTEAENLLESFSLYLDDGSGVFEASSDSLVTNLQAYALNGNGVLSISLVPSNDLLRLSYGTSALYFAVVRMQTNAVNQDPGSMLLSHVLDETTTAEPTAYDVVSGVDADVICRSNVAVVIEAIASANLAVSKVSDPAELILGTQVFFYVTVTNVSGFRATAVDVVDNLNSQYVFISEGSFYSCSNVGSIVTCRIPTLDAGDSMMFTVRVGVTSSAYEPVTNTVVVSALSPDTDPGNDTGSTVTAFRDLDGDGYADFYDPDDDGDRMDDAWEVYYGLNPYDPGDTSGDLDGDGYQNLAEYIVETVPTDSSSVFRINGRSNTNDAYVTVALKDSATGRLYTVEYAYDLLNPSWTNVPAATDLPGINVRTLFLDDHPAEPWRIYRVRVRFE